MALSFSLIVRHPVGARGWHYFSADSRISSIRAGRAGGMTEGMTSFMAGMNRNIVVHSEVSPSDRQSLCWRCIGFARASRHLVFCIYLGAGGLQCKVLFWKSIKVGRSVRALRDARRYPPSDPPQAKLAWRVRLLETLSISTTTIKFTRRLPPL